MTDDTTKEHHRDELYPDSINKWSTVSLSISEDRMQVFLSCTMADTDKDGLGEEIAGQLKDMRVKEVPEPVEIMQLIAEKFPKDVESAQITLLEGARPIPPVDARIEWKGNFFATGYAIDPVSKRIDFRQKASEPTVEKDQMLVVIHPHMKGTSGCDVIGRTIKVPNPKRSTLKAGNNVYWSEKDSGFRAKTEGRVKLQGRVINVDEVLHISEDVGTASGNVDHRGQVIVGGDVESEFKVSATGNIEVKGVILAADIYCGGNLVAVEGINSSSEKRIHSNGDIASKYILNGTITCDGDITANREIYQCHIKSRGQVVCGSGRIIGGEIMAAKAIEAEEAGSKAETKTVLIAGIDYAEYERLQKCKDKVEEVKEAIKILNHSKRKLEQIRLILTPEQKRLLVEITIELNSYLELEKLQEEEAQNIHREMVMDKSAYINISGNVYPGVVFRLYDSSYIVEYYMKGPVRAQIDPETLQIALKR